MLRGDAVHGELITDGNSSALTVLVLYTDGTADVRVLTADEYLNITDIKITLQAVGDYALIAGSTAAAGKYIAYGSVVVANGGEIQQLLTPYTCPKGVTPYFSGAASERNVCLIQGYITK